MAFPRQVPHIPRLSETHELREDVIYAHAGGVPLRFDHYRPRKVAGAAPAVVFVHGGAWMHGDPSQAARNAVHPPPPGIPTLSLSYPPPPPPPLPPPPHGRALAGHAPRSARAPPPRRPRSFGSGPPPTPSPHPASRCACTRRGGGGGGRRSGPSWGAPRPPPRSTGAARRTAAPTRRW